MIFLLCLNLFLSNPPSPVDTWVETQVKILKKSPADNPAEQSKDLFSLVFITRHVTADESTLASDWAKVTADGVSSFPMSMDLWDLAERMRRISERMNWPVKMADTDLGPAIIFGESTKKHAMLVKHGQYGQWSRFKADTPIPEGLTNKQWQLVLQARKAQLQHQSKGSQKKPLIITDHFSPTLAVYSILYGESFKAETLYSWSKKWPKKSYLLEATIRQARKEKNKKIARAIIEIGKKKPSVTFFIEAALWERSQGNAENSVKMIENALKIDPHHPRACQIISIWQKK